MRAAIGLGANLGERLTVLTKAVRALHQPQVGLRVEAISGWYDTEPLGPEQPRYINGCLILETTLTPQALLALLQQQELLAGRERTIRWGPRTLDLDLLFYGEWVSNDPHLTLPHPGLPERAFVLVPLAEIARDWHHPLLGKSVAELAAGCDRQGLVPLTDRRLVATALGPVDLRLLAPADYGALRNLAERCWWATYRGLLEDDYIAGFVASAYSLPAIAQAAESGRFWVAEGPDGQLVGFAQAALHQQQAHLVRFYIAPECQHQGIGTALWRLVRAQLVASGATCCTLTVLMSNQAAIRFYEHQGFERTGQSVSDRYCYRLALEGGHG